MPGARGCTPRLFSPPRSLRPRLASGSHSGAVCRRCQLAPSFCSLGGTSPEPPGKGHGPLHPPFSIGGCRGAKPPCRGVAGVSSRPFLPFPKGARRQLLQPGREGDPERRRTLSKRGWGKPERARGKAPSRGCTLSFSFFPPPFPATQPGFRGPLAGGFQEVPARPQFCFRGGHPPLPPAGGQGSPDPLFPLPWGWRGHSSLPGA